MSKKEEIHETKPSTYKQIVRTEEGKSGVEQKEGVSVYERLYKTVKQAKSPVPPEEYTIT